MDFGQLHVFIEKNVGSLFRIATWSGGMVISIPQTNDHFFYYISFHYHCNPILNKLPVAVE